MLIHAQFVHAFALLLTNSWLILKLIAAFSNRLLHIVVNSSQYHGDSGRIQPNPTNICNCFLPVSLMNRKTSRIANSMDPGQIA